MRSLRIVALAPVIAAAILLVGCATHNAPPPVTPTAVQSAVTPTREFIPPVTVPAEVQQATEVIRGVCRPVVHTMSDEKYSDLTMSTRLMLAATDLKFNDRGSSASEAWERWEINGYDCLGLGFRGTKPSNLIPERATIGSGQSSIKNGMQCFTSSAATDESVYPLLLALAKAIQSVQSGTFHGPQPITVQYKGNSYTLSCSFAV